MMKMQMVEDEIQMLEDELEEMDEMDEMEDEIYEKRRLFILRKWSGVIKSDKHFFIKILRVLSNLLVVPPLVLFGRSMRNISDKKKALGRRGSTPSETISA